MYVQVMVNFILSACYSSSVLVYIIIRTSIRVPGKRNAREYEFIFGKEISIIPYISRRNIDDAESACHRVNIEVGSRQVTFRFGQCFLLGVSVTRKLSMSRRR